MTTNNVLTDDDKLISFVDALAQEIRRVDGNHSLGAAALAEALTPFLSKEAAIELDRQGRGEPDRLLHGLLAIIHRDGGHYRNEHGTEKAVQDAIRIVARLIRTAEPVRYEVLMGLTPAHRRWEAVSLRDYESVRKSRPNEARALYAAPVAAQPSVPDHLIKRLLKHAENKENTAFARSAMREVVQYLSTPPADGQEKQP